MFPYNGVNAERFEFRSCLSSGTENHVLQILQRTRNKNIILKQAMEVHVPSLIKKMPLHSLLHILTAGHSEHHFHTFYLERRCTNVILNLMIFLIIQCKAAKI